MILKHLIYDILLVSQECRNSDKKLLWRVWQSLAYIDNNFNTISYEKFMEAPSNESVRRCRQALQRTDLLSGKKFIQPSIEIKEKRSQLSKENGYTYMQGKAVFNPVTNCYEI